MVKRYIYFQQQNNITYIHSLTRDNLWDISLNPSYIWSFTKFASFFRNSMKNANSALNLPFYKYSSKKNKNCWQGQQGRASALGTLEAMSLPDLMTRLSSLLLRLRKCSSPFSFHSNRTWNLRKTNTMPTFSKDCKLWSKEGSPTYTSVLHHELFKGNSQHT